MPNVYHFTMSNNEIIEIVAMDFKDACLTAEENIAGFKPSDILLVEEHHSPVPGVDTIH